MQLDEVKGHVQGRWAPGLTARQVERALGTSTRVAKALVHTGILSTHLAVHPVNRCPVSLIAEEDVEAFNSAYVSLHELAQRSGQHFRVVQRQLEADGMKAALTRESHGATFYRRSDLGG